MDSELRRSSVELANRVVPFSHAARLAGADVPEPRVSGARAWCPFGEYSHPDGGRDKALRVYYDHAFCFAEWLWLSPVKILALMSGIDDETAAGHLLDSIGYRPESYSDAWDKIVSQAAEPSPGALAEALRIWLTARYPDWAARQYEDRIAAALGACLGLLAQVRTESDCRLWLARAKQVMTMYLGGTDGS